MPPSYVIALTWYTSPMAQATRNATIVVPDVEAGTLTFSASRSGGSLQIFVDVEIPAADGPRLVPISRTSLVTSIPGYNPSAARSLGAHLRAIIQAVLADEGFA